MLQAVNRDREYCTYIQESDNAYYELGVKFQDLPGFRMAWAPGLEEIPAGCLALRADTTAAETDPRGWVETCESALNKVTPATYRMLVQDGSPRLDAQLVASGYRKRLETAFVSPSEEPPVHDRVTLKPVVTWPEWSLKCLAERESCRAGEETKGGDPLFWEELQRRKWKSGKLRCYLIEAEGHVCGTVSALEATTVLRMKNLSIRPDCRGRGFGKRAVWAFWRMALETGNSAIGAIGRGPETALFRAAGLQEVGWQADYSKPR